MSDQSKTPAVGDAGKAYAAAASAKAEAASAAPKAEPAKAADPVVAPKVAPAAAHAVTPAPVAAKPAPVAKAVAAKPVVKAPEPEMAKPAAKSAKPKTTPKKSAVKASPVAAKAAAPAIEKESKIMTTAETITTETKKAAEAMTERLKSLMGDMSTRAKTAYEKGTEMVSQASEFNKGNVEALVESGKIAAKGAQEMGQAYAEDAKKGFEELTAALKEMTTVKSPTEFIELQTKLVKKSFDTAVAQTSKNSEAFIKLAGDVFQPISNRVSVAVDSFKKAA
ncbi:phasin family protein [Blastomonas natatoria]|uniref:Phasin family protein n=1 Tax=Blastomonas natatoria TaxID=34015 RepID=A0A2V3VEI5_9SPHN|nr:phasin family protein [Blastomonas natatoria]PXW78485.1 phasin family protein [Blastomonas natatoria]